MRRTFLVSITVWVASLAAGFAQGTAFTYQGRLNENGAPYTGNAEIQATLWSASIGGTALATNTPANVVAGVTNGLFVLPLDFGANFPGASRWLQLEVRTVIGPYTALAPRQPLTPTPYAITASNLTGNLPAGQLSGAIAAGSLSGTYSNAISLNNPGNSFSGNGSGLTNLNAAQLAGTIPTGSLGHAWKITGNTGASPTNGNFLGTTDNQPLEIKVNGQRVLRFENSAPAENAPNVIGGSRYNFVAPGVVGATIAGGGATNNGGFSTGRSNSIAGDFSSIGGGHHNVIDADAHSATIGGGSGGEIGMDAIASTIGGGRDNTIRDDVVDSTIAGGAFNTAGGGYDGSSYGISIGGGAGNRAYGTYSTISGGIYNEISDSEFDSSYASVIGGGWENEIKSESRLSVIAGGHGNLISTNGDYGVICGGESNNIVANAGYAFIAGGRLNSASDYAFAAGRRAKAIHTGAFVWGDSQNADVSSTAANQFLIRAGGGVGINVTAPEVPLHVGGGSDVALAGGGYIMAGSTSGLNVTFDNNEIMARNNGAAAPLTLNNDGGEVRTGAGLGVGRALSANVLEVEGNASKTTSGGWLANSDARIKQSIETVTNALDTLNKVRLVSFRYTDDYRLQHKGIEDRPYLNVIAQEFREVFPEHVKSSGEKLSDGSDILQVDIHPLTIYSAAAVQELNSKFNAQSREIKKFQGKLSEKEAEIAELKQRLEALEHTIRARP